MTAYTTADLVIASMPEGTRPVVEDDDYTALTERITSLAATTAEMIDAEIGWDFYRHPSAEGTTTRILDGRGARSLHVHRGVISLDSLAVRFSASADWEVLDADDWELSSLYEDEGSRPYDHINLTGVGRTRFPSGYRNVRAIGAFGWTTPPARLVEANTAWVRQHLAAGDSYSGAMPVPDGATVIVPRLVMPDDVRMFLHRESHRFQECWT